MPDIASLGIELDSRPVMSGKDALDALASAADRVEPAIDGAIGAVDALGESVTKVGQKTAISNGQMNDTAAIMKRQADAARAAEEANNSFLQALQREIDLFGLSRAETAAYNAAKLGLSGATQQQAAALGATIDALRREEQAMRDAAAAEDQAAKAADAFIKRLQDQVATLNMNSQQLAAYRAAQLGVSDTAAPLIAQLAATGQGAHGAGTGLDALNFSSVAARRELVVLAHELSQGNYQRFAGSIQVLAETTGAAGLLFSAAGLAALGLAAAVAGVGYAMIKGASDQKAMNDALILTGDYAGVTSDGLNDLAHAAAASGGSIGDAKKAVTELAGSGKFTVDQIGSIAGAVVDLEHATGQSIDATIKQFETLAVQSQGSSARASEAVSKATLKLDDEYHFLTEAVYEQIRALEAEGNAKAASQLATDTYAKAVHDRAEEINSNLGTVARSWNAIKEAIGGAIDAVGNYGKKETPAIKVANLQKEIGQIDDGSFSAINSAGHVQYDQKTLDGIRAADVIALAKAQDELNGVNQKALDQSTRAIANSEASHAASRIAADDVKLQKKGMSDLQIALDEYYADINKIKIANPDSILVTPDAIAAHVAAITKAHTPVAKGQDDRAKQLQDAIVLEQTALDQEKGIYDARDKMLALYHTKFGTSDDDFYAGRAAARAQYVAAEAITFAKESALYQAAATGAKNPQEVADAKTKYDQLVKAHQDFVQKMTAAGGDDSAQILADQNKQYQDMIKSIEAVGTAEDKRLDDAIAKQKEHNAEIGKTPAQIELAKQAAIDLDTAQLQSDADYLRGAIEREGFDDKALAAYQIRLTFLDSEIAKRQQLSAALASGAVLQANADAAAAAAKSWDSTAKHVEDTLADAIANGGDKAWKKLKTSIVSQVLSVPINFVGSLAASILNPTAAQAVSGASGAASGSTGEVGSLIGLANTASSAYKLASGGLAASVGGGISSFGSAIGSTAVADFGAGFSGTASASAVADALAGDTIATGLSSAASAGAAFASAIGTAIPWIGAAVIAYKAFDAIFSDGPESDTRLTFASNNQAGNISINERGNEGQTTNPYIGGYGTSSLGTFGVSSSFWTDTNSAAVQALIKNVATTDDALASYLTTTEKTAVTTALSNHTDTIHTGAEGSDQNASGQLDSVFADRINTILNAVEPGLGKLEDGFKGTSQELATEATALLAYRNSLKDSGQAIFGAQVTLEQIAALKTPTEATSAALTRVTDEFNATNAVAAAMGKDASTAFGAVGLASEGARAQLITLAGGVSTLTSETASFSQNYLTSAEQLAPTLKAVTAAMDALGLSSITTRDQFKAEVQSLDPANAAQAQLLSQLLALEDAFAEVHAAGRSAADIASEQADLQDQLNKLTLTSAQLLEKQRDAIDDSNKALFDQVQAAQAAQDAATAAADDQSKILDQQAQLYAATGNAAGAAAVLEKQHEAALIGLSPALAAATQATWAAQAAATAQAAAVQAAAAAGDTALKQLQGAVDTQKAAVQAAADTQTAALQAQEDAANTTLQSVTSILDALNSAVGSAQSAATLTLSARQQAEATIDSILAKVKAGASLADVGGATSGLNDSLATLAKPSTDLYSSFLDYSRDQARANNALLALQKGATGQVNYAQQTVDKLTDSIKAINDSTTAELARLDKLVTDGQSALDVANGTNVAILSLNDAINNLAGAVAGISATGAAGSAPTSDSVDASISGLYQSLLGRTADVGGLAFWEKSYASGESLSDIAKQIAGSDEYKASHVPAFAAGGDHAGGLRLVGENGPEIEATGASRIWSSTQTRALLSGMGGSNNDALVAEVKLLRDEIIKLQDPANRTATASEKTSKVLVRATQGGDYIYTKAAPA